MLVSSDEVEQITHGEHRARLRKELLMVDGRLSVVRKHRADGPPGPAVVLIHGFAQNRYTWHISRRSLSAWLADAGFDTWNVELPGHGRSRANASPEEFKDYVDDLSRVLEVVGAPAFLVGHSLGGAVAYATATQAPVRGVVGIAGLFHFARTNRTLRLLCALSARIGRGPVGAVNVRTRLVGRVLSKLYGISDIMGYAFPISGWAPGSMEEDLLAERLDKGFDWTSASVWLEMTKWSIDRRFAYEEQWRRTDVPLLVLAGDLDHLQLPADAKTAFDLSGSSDRTFVTLDDYTTGHHWGHLDILLGRHAPAHVWPLLGDWLAAR